MRPITFFVFISIFLLGGGCKRKKDLEVAPQVITNEYSPLKKGTYFLYEVEKWKYEGGNKSYSTYQLKIVVKETFLDLEGDSSYKMFLYVKPAGTGEFALDSIWYAKLSDADKVIYTENSIPLLKLSLPLSLGKTWNGNLYNAKGIENYQVTTFGAPFLGFQSTVEVLQRNDSTFLYRNYRREVYAKGIGLVYKERKDVSFSKSPEDFRKGIIVDGIILKQQLVSYGTE